MSLAIELSRLANSSIDAARIWPNFLAGSIRLEADIILLKQMKGYVNGLEKSTSPVKWLREVFERKARATPGLPSIQTLAPPIGAQCGTDQPSSLLPEPIGVLAVPNQTTHETLRVHRAGW